MASLAIAGAVDGTEDFVKRTFSFYQLTSPGLIQADGDPGSDMCQVALAFLQQL